MEMVGERRIAASPQRVWEALNDPQVLRACIPGCQSLDKEADDRFTAVATAKLRRLSRHARSGRFGGRVWRVFGLHCVADECLLHSDSVSCCELISVRFDRSPGAA